MSESNQFPYEQKCFENTKTSMMTLEGLGGSKSDEVVIVIDPISDSQNVRYYCFLYEELIQAFRGAHRLYDWSYPYGPERINHPIYLLPIASGAHTHSVYNIYIDVETTRLIVDNKSDTILLTEKITRTIGSYIGVSQLHGVQADIFQGVAVNRRILEIQNINSRTLEEDPELRNATKIGDEHAVARENEIFTQQTYLEFNPPSDFTEEETKLYREMYERRLDSGERSEELLQSDQERDILQRLFDASVDDFSPSNRISQFINFKNVSNETFNPDSIPRHITEVNITDSPLLTRINNLPRQIRKLSIHATGLTTLENLPEGLKNLDCINNSNLTALPALPATLTELTCYKNSLATLPLLPAQLTNLFCGNNRLTTLPVLPETLEILVCNENSLTSLPVLPNQIFILSCNNNRLTTLPEELPENLEKLTCNNNPVRIIPRLPSTIKRVICNDCKLRELPDLPQYLEKLDCQRNEELTVLPTLSRYMISLDCSYCNLASLPRLPFESFNSLFCAGNHLTELPTLPRTLSELDASQNQLTVLPNLPKNLLKLDVSQNQLTTLPRIPDRLEIINYSQNPLQEAVILPENTRIGDTTQW